MSDQNPFIYHAPTEDQIRRIQVIRGESKDLYDAILANIKPSRERSLAITNLEQVSMWANKAITFEE